LKPFYYIFGSYSSAKIWYFFLNTNVFIEYPLLKRYFGKLAIGQSIQLKIQTAIILRKDFAVWI